MTMSDKEFHTPNLDAIPIGACNSINRDDALCAGRRDIALAVESARTVPDGVAKTIEHALREYEYRFKSSWSEEKYEAEKPLIEGVRKWLESLTVAPKDFVPVKLPSIGVGAPIAKKVRKDLER
jgi:hypothetical protein